MKILKARYLGMCFGVRDAIELAKSEAAKAPLTILGELVHNQTVLEDLRLRGIETERDAALAKTDRVMVTAHGASDRFKHEAASGGRTVIDATCPLVRSAHQALAKLVRMDYHPVVIGKRDHVEVRGLTGDFPGCDVILVLEDLERVKERPRFGVVAQTTQPLEKVHQLTGALRERFPMSEVKLVDTVCQPTKQRQYAAVEVAQSSDVVIVVGGSNSNNTRELAETCRRYCPRVHQIQNSAELEEGWIDEATTVGLTAGTSTPDSVIRAVEAALRAMGERKSGCSEELLTAIWG